MKSFKVFLVVLSLVALMPLAANAANMKAYEQMVENIDAVQAMALANQWKWTQSDIVSHVTAKEIVFEFPGNIIKKVPLPEDKMVVAVMPYMINTHG